MIKKLRLCKTKQLPEAAKVKVRSESELLCCPLRSFLSQQPPAYNLCGLQGERHAEVWPPRLVPATP